MDERQRLREAIEAQVWRGPGEASPAHRTAAGANTEVPADLASLVSKIHEFPWKITDEDVRAAKAGRTEDQLFEVIVAAAVGAAGRRLDAALRALEAS